MPTVPNWIPRAVVILPRALFGGTRIVATKSWRPTTTQVVVTLDDDKRTEIRFYLSNLRPVGSAHRRVELVNPDAPEVSREIRRIRATEAVDRLGTQITITRLSDLRGEDLVRAVTNIRDLADEAAQCLSEAGVGDA